MGKEDFAAKDAQTKAGICPIDKNPMLIILKTKTGIIYRCKICGYTKEEPAPLTKNN